MKKIYSILSLFIAVLVMISCTKDEDPLSSLNSITSFKIDFKDVNDDDITYDLGNDIKISVPFKTSLKGLKPVIKVSEKATISPASGTAIDFEDGVAKPFTVTAEDGTKKVYNVTITIRGEVGSGSRLKTYEVDDAWRGKSLTSYKYASSNFVNEYSVKIGEKTTVYKFIFNDKNQITEKKSEDGKENTVYTYNDKGQIASATYSEEGKLTYSYTYTYNDDGRLIKEVRINKSNDKEAVKEYEYKDGNVVKENRYNQPYEATYDDKNNPFIGIYPVAYSAINVGIDWANKNNPVTMTGADAAITYTYNNDNYPLTAAYTYFGAATVKRTYTYYTK